MHLLTARQFGDGTFMARTIGRIDVSSWISWACYTVGFYLAATPQAVGELRAGGPAAVVLISAVAAFFACTAMIQKHMLLSLRASTFGHPKRLVTDGVFRYSRNPIYVAFLLPLASLACLSPLAAFVGICLYLVAMTRFVIQPEERVLNGEFGNAYRDYKRSVPRWFAGL